MQPTRLPHETPATEDSRLNKAPNAVKGKNTLAFISGFRGLHPIETAIAYYYRGHDLYSPAYIPIIPVSFPTKREVMIIGLTASCAPPYNPLDTNLQDERNVRSLAKQKIKAWEEISTVVDHEPFDGQAPESNTSIPKIEGATTTEDTRSSEALIPSEKTAIYMQAINSIYNRHAAYLAASAPDTVPDSGDLTPHHQLVRSAPVISQQGTIDVQQLTALMEAHIASPSPPAVFRGQILSHPPSTDIVPPQTRQHVSLPMTRVMSMAAMSDSLNKLRGPPGGLNSTNGNTLYRNLSASDLSHRLHDIAERAAIRRRSQVSIMVTAEHINAPLRARGLSRIASVPAIAHSGTRMNDLTVYARDTDTTGPQIPLFTGSCDTNMTIPSLYGDGVLSNEHTMLNFPPGMPTGEPSFSSRPAISSTKPPVDPASFEDEDDIFMMKDTGAPAPTRTLPPSLPSAFGPIGTNRPRRASLALASRALNSATNGLPLPAAREELPALLPAILEASPSPAPAVPSVLKCPLHGDGCDGVTTTGLHRTERAIRGRGFKEVYPEIVEGGRVFVDWKKLLEEEKERVERG